MITRPPDGGSWGRLGQLGYSASGCSAGRRWNLRKGAQHFMLIRADGLPPVHLAELAVSLDLGLLGCLQGGSVLDSICRTSSIAEPSCPGSRNGILRRGTMAGQPRHARLGRIYRLREGLILLGFRHLSRHGWYPRAFSGSGWRFCTYDAHKYGHLTGRAFSPHRRRSEDGRTARGSRWALGCRTLPGCCWWGL